MRRPRRWVRCPRCGKGVMRPDGHPELCQGCRGDGRYYLEHGHYRPAAEVEAAVAWYAWRAGEHLPLFGQQARREAWILAHAEGVRA
jgi:hypothetical protein